MQPEENDPGHSLPKIRKETRQRCARCRCGLNCAGAPPVSFDLLGLQYYVIKNWD